MRVFYIINIIFFLIIKFVSGEILTTGADFLKIGAGCRSMAMGDASTSLVNDIESINANIAGLAELTNAQIMLEHAEMFSDLKYESISGALPIGYLFRNNNNFGVFAANFIYYYMTEFNRYDLWGDTVEKVKFSSFKITTSYAYSIYNSRRFIVNGGLGLDIIKKDVGGTADNKFSSSVGIKVLLLQHGKIRKIFGKYIKIGVLANNIDFGTSEINENNPVLFKTGIGANLFNKVNFDIDLSKYLDSSIKVNIGGEYWYKNMVAIRLGARIGSGQLNYFTSGLGLKYKLFGQMISLDYAMLPFTDLGITHRISLKIDLIKEKVDYAKLANIYYYKGVDFFIADKYKEAIEMWNKTLDIDSNYQKAKDRIKEAQKILKFKAKEASLKNLELQLKEFEKINNKKSKE